MELLLGSHVLEHGNRVGRLAGFELEPAELRIRRLVISPSGELGPQAVTRPLSMIATASGRTIDLGPPSDTSPLPAVADVALLSRATRFIVDGASHGRLAGVEVDLPTRRVVSVFGREHWWSRRTAIPVANVDLSTPGEIRVRRPEGTRAA